MDGIIKKRSKKAGLPPGSLVHIGERKTGESLITVLEYTEQSFRETEFKSVPPCQQLKAPGGTAWINVGGLHQIEILEKIGDCFGLHPLVLEDILNTDQRPKVEDYGDYIYVVLKTFDFDGKSGKLDSDQVSLVLGPDFVLSFLEVDGIRFDSVRERIKSGKGQIRKFGADYLMYSLLDTAVDGYFSVLEKLDDKIEALSAELVPHPKPRTLQDIQALKRESIFLRKALWPLREVINSLQRGDSRLFKQATLIYLRDVYDHAVHIIDSLETLRDLISGMLDIYLSSVSYRLGAVMKILTVIATIFMPLTLIASIYGMNFRYIPWLDWPWGFFAVLAFMAVITLAMLALFRKKKWL